MDSGQIVDARPILRLAVLPFRMLKPDPAADYLGSSLADALVSALTSLESRWPRRRRRFAAAPLLRAFSTGLRAALEGNRDEALESMQQFDGSHFRDGEGLFYVAEIFALLDLPEPAAPLRGSDAWRGIVARLTVAQTVVPREFERSRGRALLGL